MACRNAGKPCGPLQPTQLSVLVVECVIGCRGLLVAQGISDLAWPRRWCGPKLTGRLGELGTDADIDGGKSRSRSESCNRREGFMRLFIVAAALGDVVAQDRNPLEESVSRRQAWKAAARSPSAPSRIQSRGAHSCHRSSREWTLPPRRRQNRTDLLIPRPPQPESDRMVRARAGSPSRPKRGRQCR